MLEYLYRVSPIFLQTFFLNAIAWQKKRLRFSGHQTQARQQTLRDLERATPRDIEVYQLERLRDLIAHATTNIPFYRDRYREAGVSVDQIQSLDDVRRLPILSRADVQAHFDRMHAPTDRHNRIRLARTSGTTGTPLRFWWDKESEWWNSAAYYRHREWYGVGTADRQASLLGRQVVPVPQKRPPFWRYNRVMNQLVMSAFHLGDDTMQAYVEKLAEFEPQLIEGYPSTIYILARYMNSHGLTLPVQAVTTSSEPLLSIQREAIESAFQTKVFDYFGSAERVLAAGECTAHDGLHVFEPYGITEVLDPQGDPVGAGEIGRLVLTGLNNRVMPLIRYDIGDRSTWIDGACPCGCSWRRISPVTTKAEDIVVTPSGRLIAPSLLTHPFKPLDNIAASQIIQEIPEKVVIKVVKRPTYTDADTRHLLTEMQSRLGSEIKIELQFVDQIERGRTGKLRWVISKVPHDRTSARVEETAG